MLNVLMIAASLAAASPSAIPSETARSGDFGATIVLIDDWPAFLARWRQSSEGFDAHNVYRIAKDKRLTTALVFWGCAPGTDGNCAVAADFVVTTPTGANEAAGNDDECGKGRRPPDSHFRPPPSTSSSARRTLWVAIGSLQSFAMQSPEPRSRSQPSLMASRESSSFAVHRSAAPEPRT